MGAREAKRVIATAVGVLLFALGAVGCDESNPKPKPSVYQIDRNGARNSQLVATLGTCFIEHNLIPQSDIRYVPRNNGKVDTSSNEFLTAFQAYGGYIKYQNRSMSDWVDQATWNGAWPTTLCGPIPSPSRGY
jgi:hypothetical protein